MPGTAYVLFHHVMGETNEKRGVWGYVRGGMGGLTQALARAARSGSRDPPRRRCEQDHRQGRSRRGVVLAGGGIFRPRRRQQCRRPTLPSAELMDPSLLPDDFAQAIDRISYDSASLKINVALAELPDFRPSRAYRPALITGTIHICPDQDYIERA